MPTYEYKCENGHEYAEVRSMTEDQKQLTCVEEGCSARLIRVFTAPPINLKGPGFSSKSPFV